MKAKMEELIISVHPAANIVNAEGGRTYPAELKHEVDEMFEEGVGRLVDQVYGAFMYAGSKHTAAGNMVRALSDRFDCAPLLIECARAGGSAVVHAGFVRRWCSLLSAHRKSTIMGLPRRFSRGICLESTALLTSSRAKRRRRRASMRR